MQIADAVAGLAPARATVSSPRPYSRPGTLRRGSVFGPSMNQTPSSRKSKDPIPLKGCRVLLAEDEIWLALDFTELLTKAGAEIIGPAKSVKYATHLAQHEVFSCCS